LTPAVSVVLPVANQAGHIGAIVGRYLDELRGVGSGFEVVLVVNSSRDSSLEVCRELAAAEPEVEVVESSPGWGAAVLAGIGASRGEVIAYTNSARTNPEDLALAIRYALVNERLAIKASRKVRDSLVRRLGSVIYNFESRMLFGLAVWDINGTPKVFRRSMLPQLELTQAGDLIDLEFVVNCQRRKIPIVEMPVSLTERHGGRSTTNLGSAARMYLGALRMFRRTEGPR
jgi:glycosyltransferase involved in cell wall biosynthesis